MSIREEFERRCILENSVLTNHHRSAEMSSRGCRCGGGCESVLECEFWYWLRKTDSGEARALRQFQVGWLRVVPSIDSNQSDSVFAGGEVGAC